MYIASYACNLACVYFCVYVLCARLVGGNLRSNTIINDDSTTLSLSLYLLYCSLKLFCLKLMY